MRGAHVDEKVYAHPFGDPEEIYDMLTKMSYQDIRQYERSVVLKTYPNTYTFSKSLTEHLIQRRYKAMNLPIVIVRPSIVTAAQQEPVPGWVEGIAAANKAVVSCALGHVQEWIGVEVGRHICGSSVAPTRLSQLYQLLTSATLPSFNRPSKQTSSQSILSPK
jgi:fatty acyl-CoA reductase